MRLRPILASLAALAFVAAPAAVAGKQSIDACDGALAPCTSVAGGTASTANGVYFSVTTGGGNRSYASVAVECTDGSDVVVYSTVLTVVVEPKSTGLSQTIYPPASSCVATLEKQMSIDRSQTLASVSFDVVT